VRTVNIKLDIERTSVGLTLDICLDYMSFTGTVSEHHNADGSNCNSVTCQQKWRQAASSGVQVEKMGVHVSFKWEFHDLIGTSP